MRRRDTRVGSGRRHVFEVVQHVEHGGVGPGGQRVGNIVEELHGEKVDIIKYSDDSAAYVAAALSPADVVSVDLFPDGKSCRVIVPDDQLSLAIGKEGQNARLAAKLTGWKIDIKSQSQAMDAVFQQEHGEAAGPDETEA